MGSYSSRYWQRPSINARTKHSPIVNTIDAPHGAIITHTQISNSRGGDPPIEGWLDESIHFKLVEIKEKIILMMEGYVGRRNLDVIMMVPESDVIPPKDNKYTEKVDLILEKVQHHVLVKIERIFKEMVLDCHSSHFLDIPSTIHGTICHFDWLFTVSVLSQEVNLD